MHVTVNDYSEAMAAGLMPMTLAITCDGVAIKNAVAVDDVEGWVDAYVTDTYGRLVVADGSDEPEIKRHRGVIVITGDPYP